MTTQTLLIGISGVSSSGKTTLSRLLRDIFPNTFVLHEDDYYWSDNQIPIKDGVQDWDCIESIDVVGLQKSLAYIKQHGSTPPELVSKEDQNSVGETKVNEKVVQRWKERMRKEKMDGLRIAIIDGFLLFSQDMEAVWKQMDVRLFLRTKYVICISGLFHMDSGVLPPHPSRTTALINKQLCHCQTSPRSSLRICNPRRILGRSSWLCRQYCLAKLCQGTRLSLQGRRCRWGDCARSVQSSGAECNAPRV